MMAFEKTLGHPTVPEACHKSMDARLQASWKKDVATYQGRSYRRINDTGPLASRTPKCARINRKMFRARQNRPPRNFDMGPTQD
ncbi:hypothetical protein TNCV_2889951 [Trichonephila clavipes]|nr:hypothetical protein TNCV_2889951 [Trichonephila clavipes]